MRRSVSKEDNALFFVRFIFSLRTFLPSTVRPFPSQVFLLRDKMLIKTLFPCVRGPDWPNGTLNEVAIKRAKSYAADYAFSRPRASPERTSASD